MWNYWSRCGVTAAACSGAAYLWTNGGLYDRVTLYADSPTESEGTGILRKNQVPDVRGLQLKNVQVFFRHGARSPLRILTWLDQPDWPKQTILGDPTMPSIKYSLKDLRGQELDSGPYEQMYQKIVFKGGTPAGQLTKTGKMQVYELGRRLRRDYVDERKLIKPVYKADQVYVRSTNMLRTIESAKWVLSGLFDSNRRGDEIVIYSEPAERETLYPNHTFCLGLKMANKKLFRSIEDIPGLKEDRLQLQKLLQYDEDANNKRKLNYVDLRDEVAARQAHGLAVPEAVTAAMQKIELYAVKMLTFMVAGSNSYEKDLRTDIMRLACGAVLQMIQENLDSSLKDEKSYKLQLYACHDSMLMSLLVTLGVFDGYWPPFAADLTFETYQDQNGPCWVRVMYCGKVLHMPGSQGEDIIAMDRFNELLEPYALNIDTYEQECEAGVDGSISRGVHLDPLHHEQ